jgi:hypothetical protein
LCGLTRTPRCYLRDYILRDYILRDSILRDRGLHSLPSSD